MLLAVSVSFINLFVFVFDIVLLVRVVWSWFNPPMTGALPGLLLDLTEPVLLPIRKILPRSQVLDFSPLVAFILLQLLSQLANWLGGSA
jgi:YggT family protein